MTMKLPTKATDKPNNRFFSSIASFLLGVFVVTGLSVLYAWTGPTSQAPNGNVRLPLNEGPIDQVKDAGLAVTNLVADTVSSSQGLYVGIVNLATMLANGVAITSPKYCIGTSCITAWPTGGSGGGTSSTSTGGWVNVPTGTTSFNSLCQYRWRVHPTLPSAGYYYSTSVDDEYAYSLNSSYEDGGASVSPTPIIKSVRAIDNNPSLQKNCGGVSSSTGSGWETVELTDTEPYDTACIYKVKYKAGLFNNNTCGASVTPKIIITRFGEDPDWFLIVNDGVSAPRSGGIPKGNKSQSYQTCTYNTGGCGDGGCNYGTYTYYESNVEWMKKNCSLK